MSPNFYPWLFYGGGSDGQRATWGTFSTRKVLCEPWRPVDGVSGQRICVSIQIKLRAPGGPASSLPPHSSQTLLYTSACTSPLMKIPSAGHISSLFHALNPMSSPSWSGRWLFQTTRTPPHLIPAASRGHPPTCRHVCICCLLDRTINTLGSGSLMDWIAIIRRKVKNWVFVRRQ